ncbi:DUF1080 domain-containing protein [Gilvimarinus sp. SDUM040013]|uniref:DUF1080 domain-containing protein n=1 Tax=Gilvimarinus gilvus TaxID=3058038 RepID=A0ABU4S2P1_9GAMM|nr:DUF1080 domain-containing protein [Gilvimarinus sp. SDUM040013]MDO3385506.1 DUF1080 domain-containing protein [Gilvimarinus sp. SDUM040013]MDX6851416.1 DUF1080 domain-containing protein [Gilvimarinus sp. SDUM040013]
MYLLNSSVRLFALSTTFMAAACVAAEKEPWQLAQETEVWEPVPAQVSFNKAGVPSDAIVLFDGSGLEAWESAKDSSAGPWNIKGDVLETNPKTGDIRTRQDFCDVQLHIEWQAPPEDLMEGPEGQGRGNSGVFFQERYEVQVLDSHGGETYPNGQAGSIYKQHIPLVNATKPLTQWNVYDIIYRAPRFDESGDLVSPAFVTVLHNGVLVQNHAEIQGPTSWIGHPPYEAHGCAPLRLQDHGNPTKFKNIWVREL